MDKLIIRYLSAIEHGELQEFNNMVVLPLFTSVNHGPEYLPMGKAMEKGLLTITEINDNGRVPELRVVNKAESQSPIRIFIVILKSGHCVPSFDIIRDWGVLPVSSKSPTSKTLQDFKLQSLIFFVKNVMLIINSTKVEVYKQ